MYQRHSLLHLGLMEEPFEHRAKALLQGICSDALPKIMGVAVSGGSDSLCLTLLLRTWCSKLGIHLIPLMVDHGLRPDSTSELHQNRKWLAHWGLDATLIQWHHPPLCSAYMEAARRGRYQVLALACHRLGIRHVWLGHHQDDVLETVLMRQLRHSGWRGLAGISAISHGFGLTFLRPLLSFPKQALEDQLCAWKQPWIVDPTNSNPHFTRTQMRARVHAFSRGERKTLLRTIGQYGQRRHAEAQALQHTLPVSGSFFLTLPLSALALVPATSWDITLQSWINGLFTSSSPLSKACVAGVWQKLNTARLQVSPHPRVLATAGGCLFLQQRDTLFVFRENRFPKEQCRGSFSALNDKPQEGTVWDSRFFFYEKSPPLPQPEKSLPPWIQRTILASFPPAKEGLFRAPAPPYPVFIPS